MNKKDKKKQDIPYTEIQHTPLMAQSQGIPWVNSAQWVTSIPTQLPSWTISGNLNITGAIVANNITWTNTWDETTTTIKSKLWQSWVATDGWLSSTDWNTFNGKADKGLAGIKEYYVSDTSGWATTRKLTFTDWILTSEI